MAKDKSASVVGKAREIASLAVSKHMAPKAEKRASKPVTRSMPAAASPAAPKPFEIPKGKGKKLGDIEYVESMLDKKTGKDEALQALHRFCFNAPARTMFLKKHLREFSGVVFSGSDTEEKLKARIDNRPVNLIRDVCTLVGLDRSGTKEELVDKLLDFLKKPAQTDAEVPKKTAKRSKPSSSKGSKKAAPKSKKAKKEKKGDGIKKPLSAYMFFVKDNREEIAKKHPSEKVTEIAKRLGEAWKKLKEKEKATYTEKAKKDKARYEKAKSKGQ